MDINLTDNQEVGNLSLTPPTPIPTDKYLNHQATKLSIALGENSPGVGEITAGMSSGNSEYYMQLLAEKDLLQRQSSKNDILDQIMQSGPENITPEVINIVQGLSDQDMAREDLGNLLEEKYSEKYVNTAVTHLDEDTVDSAMQEDQGASLEMIDRADRMTYKNNIAMTALDSLKRDYEESGWFSKGWDFVERMIPFREWYLKQNVIGADFARDYPLEDIVPGTNLLNQYSYLALTDPKDFNEKFTAAYEYLKERNPQVAMSWVEGFLSYGTSDAILDNIFGVVDVASVLPVSKLGKLGKALRGVVKGGVVNPNNVEKIAAEMGKFEESAVAKTFKDINSGDFFQQNIKNIKDLENSIPSITSPLKTLEGTSSLPQEAITRLKEAMVSRSDRIKEIITNPNLIDTLTTEEYGKLAEEARVSLIKDYPSVGRNVIDVRKSDVADIGNVYSIDILIGRRDGTLFQSEAQAKTWMSRYVKPKFDEYYIEQVGDGYRGVIRKSIDESRLLDNNFKIELDQTTPKGFWNTNLSVLRSPDYLLSKQNVEARGVSVHTMENLAHSIDELSQPIKNLGTKEFNELNDLWELNRTQQKYYDNIGEFSDAFYMKFNKAPTEKQVDVYFASVQINDLDLVVRDLNWYKQKTALGLEDFTIKHIDEKTKTISDLNFEGKLVDNLPFSSKDKFTYIIMDKGKPSKVFSSRFGDVQKTRDLIAKGYKIVQVSDQALKVGDRYVGFVITNDFKRGRIGVKNIDRKPGGHKIHDFDYYIKQGNLIDRADGSQAYSGDISLWGIRNEKEGKEVLQALETAREMTLNKNPAATSFVRDTLGIDPKDWYAAIKRGDINLKTPLGLVRKGTRTYDTGMFRGIEDLSQNEHNLSRNMRSKFGGERDTKDIKVLRSEGGVTFRTEDATYLTPIDTLRHATGNMISVRVMDDYVTLTARNFLREFGDILKTPKTKAESDMVAVLSNPEFLPGAPVERIAAAKNVSRSYNNLLNYGTEVDRKVNLYKERLINSILPKFGPRGQQWVSDKMLPLVRDPTVFLRSVAFHSKMGLYNPKQLFLQANQAVNIVAIGGVNGMKGVSLYPLMRSTMWTNRPENLRALAKTAESVGLMKADDFLEAIEAYKRSGFNTIGKDVAYLDDLKGSDIRRTKVGQGFKSFLDLGTTPFKEGERIARMSGWMTAYLERKALVKGRALTRRDYAAILQRSKDLVGNMTRDSNAAWQKGYGAVFTQFFGYSARIAEQLLGKKLTPAERMRLFAGYSVVYGVPSAVTAGTVFLPVREMVREEMMSQGYDPDDSTLEPFIDGFASSLLSSVIGEDINVAGPYGPGGIPTFYDIIKGDKEIGDLFLGASGSIAGQILMDSIPAIKGMMSEFSDFDGGYYNLTASDFLRPLRNITTVNNAVNLWNVYNFQRWASKNGVDLMQMDLPEATLAAFTGLQPQEMEDTFSRFNSNKEFRDHINSVKKEAERMFRSAMRMEADDPNREITIRNVKTMMELEGLSEREKVQVWRNAFDTETLQEKSLEQYDKIQKAKELKHGN